jgi:hypothetical protein
MDAQPHSHGGDVPIGAAVATDGGKLPCGVVHAVAMGYSTHDGARIKATSASVSEALASALVAAAAGADHRTAATRLFCSRPGYSTVEPPARAPKVMLQAMLDAVHGASNCGLVRLTIFVPEGLVALPRPTVTLQAGTRHTVSSLLDNGA